MVDNSKRLETNSTEERVEEKYILPRQAWNSQLAYLKTILKAKQALARIEKKAAA
ncbi:MAG: hypothetical protein AB1589_26510 [Cyanobacteriota bacterium]